MAGRRLREVTDTNYNVDERSGGDNSGRPTKAREVSRRRSARDE